jgi:hypothetical protein
VTWSVLVGSLGKEYWKLPAIGAGLLANSTFYGSSDAFQ